MSSTKRPPAFDRFIRDLRTTWAELPDMAARMKRGQQLLEALVKDPSLRAASREFPASRRAARHRRLS